LIKSTLLPLTLYAIGHSVMLPATTVLLFRFSKTQKREILPERRALHTKDRFKGRSRPLSSVILIEGSPTTFHTIHLG